MGVNACNLCMGKEGVLYICLYIGLRTAEAEDPEITTVYDVLELSLFHVHDQICII